jgi:hypothetical protein
MGQGTCKGNVPTIHAWQATSYSRGIPLADTLVTNLLCGKTLKTGEKNSTLRVAHPGLRGERHAPE